MISCLRRWIAAFRKDCSERGLQKMDSDLRNLVTVEDMKKFEISAVARHAIKLLSAASTGAYTAS